MYQKQEITIDRRSPQAMEFFTGMVMPYIQELGARYSEEPYVVHYFAERAVSKPVMEVVSRYVDLKKNITNSGSKIIVTLEEDWTKVYATREMFIKCDSFPEGVEPDDGSDIDEEEYIDSKYGDFTFIKSCSSSSDENTEDEEDSYADPWNYRAIEQAYLENEEQLSECCKIKIVRGFDPTERDGAFVQVWDSHDHDRIIRASNNCGRSFYEERFFHLDTGIAAELEALPDRRWFGVEPEIQIKRLNGMIDKEEPFPKVVMRDFLAENGLTEFTDEYEKEFIEYHKKRQEERAKSSKMSNPFDPDSYAKPITAELAAKYRETPEYVKAAEEAIGTEIIIEVCLDGFCGEGRDELWCDTLWINNTLKNVSTEKLVNYINALSKLVESIDNDNEAILTELGLKTDSEHSIFMMFYTKDFDLLEIYYDYDDRRLKCDLFEYGSEKNGVIDF